jgi:hypothetical protein
MYIPPPSWQLSRLGCLPVLAMMDVPGWVLGHVPVHVDGSQSLLQSTQPGILGEGLAILTLAPSQGFSGQACAAVRPWPQKELVGCRWRILLH